MIAVTAFRQPTPTESANKANATSTQALSTQYPLTSLSATISLRFIARSSLSNQKCIYVHYLTPDGISKKKSISEHHNKTNQTHKTFTSTTKERWYSSTPGKAEDKLRKTMHHQNKGNAPNKHVPFNGV